MCIVYMMSGLSEIQSENRGGKTLSAACVVQSTTIFIIHLDRNRQKCRYPRKHTLTRNGQINIQLENIVAQCGVLYT